MRCFSSSIGEDVDLIFDISSTLRLMRHTKWVFFNEFSPYTRGVERKSNFLMMCELFDDVAIEFLPQELCTKFQSV